MHPFYDETWFRLFFGFLMGGILGSFGTMLAYRLPRRLSLIKPRSHCPSCGATLGVIDLVPLFSWMYLKGRCRRCRAEIGKAYFAIELITALSCAFATFMLGVRPITFFAYAVILAIIVSLSPKLHDKGLE